MRNLSTDSVACLALLLSCTVCGQKQANVWHFGVEGGLSFNTMPPSPISGGQTYYPGWMGWNEGTSSICDSAGTLLLYSNGAKVWNAQQQVTPNGDGIMGHVSSSHAALIVPRPNSDRFSYLFTTDGWENDFANGLRYSVLDACADNGLGDVVPAEKNVLLHGYMAEKLAAVRHANGQDYWIVAHEYMSNVFHVYRLTPNGITDSLATAIGPADNDGTAGQIVFSPDGSQLAYVTVSLFGYLSMYDFDTATGTITNERIWNATQTRLFWGAAFSPDATILYFTTSNNGRIRQLNLVAGSWTAIQNSEVTLGTLLPDLWRDLRLGPDGLIYVSRAQSNKIGVIQVPNALGTACQFADSAVAISGTCSFGLPNVVCNYDYCNAVPQCGNPEGIDEHELMVTVHPNPTDGPVMFSVKTHGTIVSVRVCDAAGRTVHATAARFSKLATIELGHLEPGVYTLHMQDGAGAQHAVRLVRE